MPQWAHDPIDNADEDVASWHARARRAYGATGDADSVAMKVKRKRRFASFLQFAASRFLKEVWCLRGAATSAAERKEKNKVLKGSSARMAGITFHRFKCVVVATEEEFGSYCRERAPGEQNGCLGKHGATKRGCHGPGPSLEALMEVCVAVGPVQWPQWVLKATGAPGSWVWWLRSLLGRLWWRWIDLLWHAMRC